MLDSMGPLKASLICLQHGKQRILTDFKSEIYVDFDIDPIINIEEYCAQIMNMSIVITIDNSTAHLSAALGIKTILLLPYSPEWRWGLDVDYSYWYESISIVRQEISGDWSSALDEAFNLAEKLLSAEK